MPPAKRPGGRVSGEDQEVEGDHHHWNHDGENVQGGLNEKNRSHASGLHAILEQVVGDNGNSGMVKEKINKIIEKAREYIN